MLQWFLQLIIACLSLSFISSLSTGLDGTTTPFCYKKLIDHSDTMKLAYQVAGEANQTIGALINDDEGNELYRNENSEKGWFQGQINRTGYYTLCFYPYGGEKESYISFDFYTNMERGYAGEMAEDKTLKATRAKMGEIHKFFEKFENNMKFIGDRRATHTNILNDVVYSVQRITIIKIVLIALISLLQVIFIQKFFGSENKVTNQDRILYD